MSVGLISTRKRVTWTKDQWKLLNRTSKLLNDFGDRFVLRCGSPVCPDSTIALIADDSDARKRVLVCGCTVRAVQKDF